MAEIVYNNMQHSSTGVSPFYANYGHNPIQPSDIILPDSSHNPDAYDTIFHLQNIQGQLTESILTAQEDHARFYNKKILKAPQYEVGDLVWLL